MRASRLLAIMILLQLRGRLTADDLAREFEVSVRTIYRDIDALSAAGVPVYGDRGHGGGFQLLDGYRTSLTGLSPQEAEALLLIGLPAEALAPGLQAATVRARDKVLAAMPSASRAAAGRTAQLFNLDAVDWYRQARPAPHLASVARALTEGRRLAMTYTSWTRTRDWTVEPHGLVLKGGNWYLAGWTGEAMLSFSVADIAAVQVLEQPVIPQAGFVLADWWAASQRDFERRLRPDMARLKLSPLGCRRLALLGAWAAQAVAGGAASDGQGWREVALPLEAISAAAPQLLSLGPEFTVLDPPQLAAEIARLAQEISRMMENRP